MHGAVSLGGVREVGNVKPVARAVDGIEDRGGRAGPTATVAETNSTRACTHKWRFASAA